MKNFITKYYKNLPISIIKIIIAGLVVSVFFILKSFANHIINQYNYPFSWLLIALKISNKYLLWSILTPIAYFLAKIIQNTQSIKLTTFFKFLIGCIVLSLFHQFLTTRIDDFINYANSGYLKSFWGRNNIVVLAVGSFSSFIELLVIIAVFLAFDYQKKFFKNQKALIASQLNALRMQLQPHFLFNTLHSIASMIDIDTKDAQKMLSKLGDLLRNILEYDEQQLVSVSKEIKFIKDYLDLEQIRYQDRVLINYDISEDVLENKIPNMIFQPLVENAVKYGIFPTLDNGEILISIKKEYSQSWHEEALVLEISNSYNINNQYTKPISTGVGLINIRKRLQQFYHDRFSFESDFVTPELYSAKIILPIIK